MKPLFLTLPREEQRAIIEALIFAANPDEVLTIENILSVIMSNSLEGDAPDFFSQDNTNEAHLFDKNEVEKIINEINYELSNSSRPYRIVNFANSYQFATLPQYGEIVHRMLRAKTKRSFSNAQLETLAIVAYKQPVTKQEIDRIRGVTSSGDILNTLIDKQLVEIAGRKDTIGKPLLYSTSTEFLKIFGLKSLDNLPKLKELEEIAEQKIKEEEENTNPELVLTVTQKDIDKLGEEGVSNFEILEE